MLYIFLFTTVWWTSVVYYLVHIFGSKNNFLFHTNLAHPSFGLWVFLVVGRSMRVRNQLVAVFSLTTYPTVQSMGSRKVKHFLSWIKCVRFKWRNKKFRAHYSHFFLGSKNGARHWTCFLVLTSLVHKKTSIGFFYSGIMVSTEIINCHNGNW